ncbi:hypothetical protein NQ318_015525 [Aromia moschata]|uniref:C-type lectin domain-containing protein n=1 Tax=Aromia moschata TaxID=1265417 RepID=A0AAV8XR10_9CUCU|nr:hypothetical protein NQ318_015525 [Aromia moschata]
MSIRLQINLEDTENYESSIFPADWRLQLQGVAQMCIKIGCMHNCDLVLKSVLMTYRHSFQLTAVNLLSHSVMQCADDRLHMFNNFCYLIVSYPETAWNTSQQICAGLKATLASVLTAEEERFITANIRKRPSTAPSALLAGSQIRRTYDFRWIDGYPMNYSGWLPGQTPTENDLAPSARCLGMRWTPSPTPMLPSGLYWKAEVRLHRRVHLQEAPRAHGGRHTLQQDAERHRGQAQHPQLPRELLQQPDFSVKISGPDRTRIVVEFDRIDVEPQLECLYDYVELSRFTRRENSRTTR